MFNVLSIRCEIPRSPQRARDDKRDLSAVKKCNGGCPFANPSACEIHQIAKLSEFVGSAAVFLVQRPPPRAPLQIVTLPLEGEVEPATKHAKIIFRPIDHAEAQVVSQTDVPRDSEFETGAELAEQFVFATEVMRLGMDSERVRRPLCGEDIPFAAAKNRTDTGPGVGRKTCARNWIAQCKCS